VSEENYDRLIGAVAKMSALPDSDKVNIRGKLYAEVHTRVQAFREAYGENGRIVSSIHIADETKVLVETTVSVFVDGSWRVIANDFAEEYRASGPVNKTSAVENCCTSSIGRSLAACGLSGGNYASFDEVSHAINDKAEAPEPEPEPEPKPEKPKAKKKQPKPKPVPVPAPEDQDSDDPTVKNIDDYDLGDPIVKSEEGATNLVGVMLELATEFSSNFDELKEFWEKNKVVTDVLDRDWHDQFEVLREGFTNLKQKLDDEEATG
jgi:hypothetical protein